MAPLETAIALWGDRHFPIQAVAEGARALEGVESVDGVLLCDQIPGWVPNQLWDPEFTPLAEVTGDPDSAMDAFAVAAYLAAAAPSLRMSVSTDAIRRGPAELIQTMITLAAMTGGNSSFQIGGGEAKQSVPYGHDRSTGMARMKDLFEIFSRLMEESGGPIDYEGKQWTFEGAAIGSAIPHRPEIMALGGGPLLMKHAAKYCDGLAMMCPSVWSTPEQFAEEREKLLAVVEENGRDPEAFRFAVWFPILVHEDEQKIAEALENKLVKWMAATAGRIGPTDMWRKDGLEPPIPDGWVYYEQFLPYATDQAFLDDVLANTAEEHCRAFWMAGDSAEVANTLGDWIDAGVDWVCPMDYAGVMAFGAGEAEDSLRRQIEVCSLLRERTKAAA